ncbi:hypothetical protein FQR65_LT12904 [Abscondita terminalis]|nr:hypothetical protein FQR65_LT12904 [Abscondita terminalis]
MAKWGEGDPRWIVEERPDATNVNNWHWTERDASVWSKERIKNLFLDAETKIRGAKVKITEIEKCEGEASANNRKGKLIFFYEWVLVFKWEGQLENSNERHQGTITIPNLSEENEVHEVDIQIVLKEDLQDSESLKEILNKEGKEFIRNLLKQYLDSLQVEFSKGMILPPKDGVHSDKIKNLSSGFNKVSMQPIISKSSTTKGNVDTATLQIKEKFQCRARELFDVLTRVEMVMAFTRSEVKLVPVQGGSFELFGGNITGTFEELIPEKKIVQKWRYKQWPLGHFSTVTITFSEKSDHTEIVVKQTQVPKSEVDITKQNWERYYWNSIKQTFGFGAFLP